MSRRRLRDLFGGTPLAGGGCWEARRSSRFIADYFREDFADVFAAEEALAGDELVEHDSEGEDVGALVGVFAAGLLGAM